MAGDSLIQRSRISCVQKGALYSEPTKVTVACQPFVKSVPSSPNAGPPSPVPIYLPSSKSMAPPHIAQSQTTASSPHDPTFPSSDGSPYTLTFRGASPSFGGVPAPFGGTSPPTGGHRFPTNPYIDYASSSRGPAVFYHATFQASPSPQANASPAYGGEAHHHMPLGINPSPQISLEGSYGAYAIALPASTIPECTVVQTTSERQEVQADSSGTSCAKPGKSGRKPWYRRSREYPVIQATPERQEVQADVSKTSCAKPGKSGEKRWYRLSQGADA